MRYYNQGQGSAGKHSGGRHAVSSMNSNGTNSGTANTDDAQVRASVSKWTRPNTRTDIPAVPAVTPAFQDHNVIGMVLPGANTAPVPPAPAVPLSQPEPASFKHPLQYDVYAEDMARREAADPRKHPEIVFNLDMTPKDGYDEYGPLTTITAATALNDSPAYIYRWLVDHTGLEPYPNMPMYDVSVVGEPLRDGDYSGVYVDRVSHKTIFNGDNQRDISVSKAMKNADRFLFIWICDSPQFAPTPEFVSSLPYDIQARFMRVFDTMVDDPNIREYYIDPMIAWWNKHPDVTPDQTLPLPRPVLRQRALAKYGKQVGDVSFEEMVELCTRYRNDPEVPDPLDPNVARFAMRDGKVVVEYIGFGNDSDDMNDTNDTNTQHVTDTQAGSLASLFGAASAVPTMSAASAVPSGSAVSTGSLPPAPSSIQPIAPPLPDAPSSVQPVSSPVLPAHMYLEHTSDTGTSASAPAVSTVSTDTSSLSVFTPYAAPQVIPAPPLAARPAPMHDNETDGTDKLAFNPDGSPRLTPYMQPDKWPELCKFTRPVKHMTRKLEGREDLIKSMLAAFERPELCNVILLAGAGTGKALVNGTPIAVDDARGFVPIEQLAVGDKVFALDGKPTRVTGVFPQGVKQVWRVEFADGTHIDCNSSHVWPVIVGRKQIRKARGFEPDEPRSFIDEYVDDDKHTMTTKELYERMEGIRHGQGSNMPNLYVPANGPVSRTCPAWPKHGIFDDDDADAMLKQLMSQGYGAGVSFGMSLGAHGNDAPDACGFTLHTTHPEAIEQLARLHDVKPNVETSRQVFNSTPMYVATFDHMDRADMTGPFLDDDGFLHDWVLAARRDIMLAVVRGVFDARGYVTAKRKHIVAVSLPHARLAEQLLSLLSSLGVRGFMTTRRNPKRTAEHVVQVLADHERLQQLFASRTEAVDAFKGVPCSYSRRGVESFGTRITAVYPLHKKTHQTCIMVEDAQHCFLAGYTNMPTHNTALVQGTMEQDPNRLYLEVDLARMLADIEPDKMAARIKMLFDEVEHFVKDSHVEIVLFIDEFHQIVELSAAAVEALKPLLAASGTRGVRVVAATTYIEFREFIAPNQPLVERLQRINVPEPDEELTVKIVKGFAKTYGVERDIAEHIYHEIYELTNRYIPANNQPRKSILMLDAMTGWHRLTKQPMNHDLLAQCLMSQEGVNVDMNVDAAGIKAQLDKRVFDQTIATTAIESNLQTAVAGMNDPTKPMATLLFSGSSGVGKLVSNDTPTPICDDGDIRFKNHGDLVPGDMVFDRLGQPTLVTAVFPQHDIDMYRVTFDDGRTLDVGAEHLWTVYSNKQRSNLHAGKHPTPMVKTTKELLDTGLYLPDGKTVRWYIPANGAVQWPARQYDVDPYVVGAFIGNGCLTSKALEFSSDDEFTVAKIAKLLGTDRYDQMKNSYSWLFARSYWRDAEPSYIPRIQTKDVFDDMPELMGKHSPERRIPEQYMTGSIEQRWRLVQGLFDTDGCVHNNDRVRVSYSTFSKDLADDIRSLLFSLGVPTTLSVSERDKVYKDRIRHLKEYTVRVKSDMEGKKRFFSLPRKLAIIDAWMSKDRRERVKKFDTVPIYSIEYIGKQDAQCILVDNDEHLYQAGQFVVTHNTEVAKQLSQILFGDGHNMIRFDMSEYANADSLNRFRTLLTAEVWAHPYCVLLLDEIEKADATITRLLLSVLDDGRLTDENDRVVNFTNCYVIMTTNAGSEIFQTMGQFDTNDRNNDRLAQQQWLDDHFSQIRESLQSATSKFPPELLGRVGRGIIPFRPLTRITKYRILHMYMDSIAERFRVHHGVEVVWQGEGQAVHPAANRVEQFIIEDQLDSGNANAGGGREVKLTFDSLVLSRMSACVNQNKYAKKIEVRVAGTMRNEDKSSRLSKSLIEVVAVK